MSSILWLAHIVILKWKFFETLSDWLLRYGLIGIFGVALLDSAFVPMPSGPDVLLVMLSLKSPALTIVGFALAATIGSTIGCTLLYLVSRRLGVSALKRISPARRKFVEEFLGRYDALALVIASIMPPPFPFKPFILTAGVFNFKLPRFIIALLFGRALRYSVLGMLTLYFGNATLELMRQHGPQVLLVVIAVIGLVVAIRYLLMRQRRSEVTVQQEEPL
ncbi:MAG: VTT domain-containing protein [Acidobacteriota bacterium]